MVLWNGPFAQAPIGVAILLIGMAMRLPNGSPATGAAWFGGFASLLVALVWVVAPPAYAKQAWIRAKEHELGGSQSPSVIEVWSWWVLVAVVGATLQFLVAEMILQRL